MKLRLILLTLILAGTRSISAQFSMPEREIELQVLLDSLRASKTDFDKLHWNTEFKKLFASTLAEPTAYAYPFERLTTVGKIPSPDNQIRIICWNIEQDDQSQKYCAFVLKLDERKGTHKVFELVDNSEMLPLRTDEILDANNWYGALYYQIIPVEKGGKTYYTVLGIDPGSTVSKMKLIDALSFTGNNLKIGAPIFKSGDQTLRRVYFEHSKKSSMSLRWEAERQRIIFDHLSPETPTLAGFYEYYVPDFTYDAFVYQGTKWVLQEDVIGINGAPQQVSVHSISKSGDIEEAHTDSKWIDPTSSGAPGGKETHVAVTPELDKDAVAKRTEKDPKKEPQSALQQYDAQKKHKKEKEPGASFNAPKSKKKKRK